MSKLRVTIIDYGLGNLLSLQRAFEFIGVNAIITREHKLILGSTHVILPGVGAFPMAMDSIIKFKLKESLLKVANSGIPLLGICLGMQLLLTESEEFEHTRGLNLIPGKVNRIHDSKNKSKKIKIPHIGWNTLIPNNINNNFELKLLEKTGKEDSYYFVHSFTSIPDEKEHRIYETVYEDINLSAIIKKKNILGFQFHPEKSGRSGLQILRNFLQI